MMTFDILTLKLAHRLRNTLRTFTQILFFVTFFLWFLEDRT